MSTPLYSSALITAVLDGRILGTTNSLVSPEEFGAAALVVREVLVNLPQGLAGYPEQRFQIGPLINDSFPPIIWPVLDFSGGFYGAPTSAEWQGRVTLRAGFPIGFGIVVQNCPFDPAFEFPINIWAGGYVFRS